ncbi:unnamed protein product [Symbiodinium natans]|uniref:Uncharacterized protein n=1 Tax=Symbiodinium natans TaxID=878477 RepID=A0A812PYH5_9DINO|nr:unnamed protein product [Symbiodinium natans]
MAAVAPALSSFQGFPALSRMPEPKKPPEVASDLDVAPLPPLELLTTRLWSDGVDAEVSRRVCVDSPGMAVGSLESWRSYFSESFPDIATAPPNRILHNLHTACMDKLAEEMSTGPGRLKLKNEVAVRRHQVSPDNPKRLPWKLW